MSFQLPSGSDLTIEQLDIINLPTNRNWLIKGGPGTGKTAMAIWRVCQMRGKKVLLLVNNKPLMLLINSLWSKESLRCCRCNTYHNWLNDLYREMFKSRIPQITPLVIDWDQVKSDFLKMGKIYDHVVIDGAEDFPKEFFNCIKEVANNVTCFMDSNQTLVPENTDIIATILTFCRKSPYSLTKNLRNPKEMYDAASLFCDVKAISNCAISNKIKPVLHECFDIKDFLNKTCDIIEQNQNASVGIIVNNKSINYWHNTIVDELEGRGIYGLVEMYKPGFHNISLDFTKDNVKIMSFGATKGLEFDMVLIPRFDRIKSFGDDIADRNRIYVAMTRAKEELHLFYITKSSSPNYIDTFSIINPNEQLFTWD